MDKNLIFLWTNIGVSGAMLQPNA